MQSTILGIVDGQTCFWVSWVNQWFKFGRMNKHNQSLWPSGLDPDNSSGLLILISGDWGDRFQQNELLYRNVSVHDVIMCISRVTL